MSNLPKGNTGQVKNPNQLEYVGNYPNKTTPSTYHAWIDVEPITPKKRTDSHIKEQKKNDIDTAKEKAKDNLKNRLSQIGHDFKSARKNEKLWKQVKAEYKKLNKQYIEEIHKIRQSNRNNASNAIRNVISNQSFPVSKKNVPKIDQPSHHKKQKLIPNKKIVLPNGMNKKGEVNIEKLSPKLKAVLPNIAKAFENSKTGFKPLISSGNDSKHSKNSSHFSNEAIDLSSWSADYKKYMTADDAKKIAKEITGSSLKPTPLIPKDPGRMQSDWDTDGDGKRDFIVIVEYPGIKDKQHLHIQVAPEKRGK